MCLIGSRIVRVEGEADAQADNSHDQPYVYRQATSCIALPCVIPKIANSNTVPGVSGGQLGLLVLHGATAHCEYFRACSAACVRAQVFIQIYCVVSLRGDFTDSLYRQVLSY